MKVIIALLLGFTLSAHAEDEPKRPTLLTTPAPEMLEAANKNIRNHILKNIYSDCYGREATDAELEADADLSLKDLLERRKSEECNTEDANARRKDRAEEMLAQIRAREEAKPAEERGKITRPENIPEQQQLATAASATR